MSTFKIAPLAAATALALGLGAAGNAYASAYAVAFNHIKNGTVAALVSKDGGVTFAVDSSILFFQTPNSVSTASATLNGTGTSNSASGPPAPDALAANGTGSVPVRTNELLNGVATGPTGTSYTMFGDDLGNFTSTYSSSDAKVVTEQSDTGTPIEAWAISESNIPSLGFADATSRNASSTALFSVDVVATPDCATYICIVSIKFDANPYLHDFLDVDARPGSVARPILDTSATLTKLGALVPTFAWAPNGVMNDGIFGGTEFADGENLNLTFEALIPGENETFSPQNTFSSFQAVTSGVGVGTYTLSLQMGTKTDVKRIPEPATLALLGLGLAGIGYSARRKKV